MYKLALIAMAMPLCGAAIAENVSPKGVKTLAPSGAITPVKPWDLATRAVMPPAGSAYSPELSGREDVPGLSSSSSSALPGMA
jgi:hypothetical protein